MKNCVEAAVTFRRDAVRNHELRKLMAANDALQQLVVVEVVHLARSSYRRLVEAAHRGACTFSLARARQANCKLHFEFILVPGRVSMYKYEYPVGACTSSQPSKGNKR